MKRAAGAMIAAIMLAGANGAAGEETKPLAPGSTFLSPELKALQADDAANPGMLWVSEGEALWNAAAGATGKACASCHGAADASMKGASARFPAMRAGKLLNLELQINDCRQSQQRAEAFPYESSGLLALTAYIAFQSRGEPLRIDASGEAAPHYERGRAFFVQRQGQLNLSCAQCHDGNAGRRLRGDIISHGAPTGFPIYRIEWQGMGSLHRRLRACSLGVRAVQFDYGSDEYLSLELYLAKRAEGAPVEAPAIRK